MCLPDCHADRLKLSPNSLQMSFLLTAQEYSKQHNDFIWFFNLQRAQFCSDEHLIKRMLHKTLRTCRRALCPEAMSNMLQLHL